MPQGVAVVAGESYFRAAFSYLYIRDFERALAAFRAAIASNPEEPRYYFHGSLTAWRNGDLQLAEHWAKQAVVLAPTHSLYRHHWLWMRGQRLLERARRALARGDLEAAARYARAASRCDPLDEAARSLLRQLGADDDTDDIDTGGESCSNPSQ
jgi:tetratricopeptide (TPR) repeat protein